MLTHRSSQALREHLLAVQHAGHPSLKVENLHTANSASPHDQNIDPAIAGSGMMSTSAGESGGDDNGSDGKRGGKRELSTSKRAAQNRAAQVRVQLLSFIHRIDVVVDDRLKLNIIAGVS